MTTVIVPADEADDIINLTVYVYGEIVPMSVPAEAPGWMLIPAKTRYRDMGPPERWEIRNTAGVLLDLNQSIQELGIVSGAQLHLFLRPGFGG